MKGLGHTLADECYERLKRALIEGYYLPGQKLKMEDLSDDFSMGYSPIREALSRLAAKGLVNLVPNKGFHASPVSREDMEDLYLSFFLIEKLVLKEAMKNGDAIWQSRILLELKELSIVESMCYLTDYAVWSRQTRSFSQALISGCPAKNLIESRNHLYELFERYGHIAFHLSGRPLSVDHQRHAALANAVLGKDSDKAALLVEANIYSSFKNDLHILTQHKYIQC